MSGIVVPEHAVTVMWGFTCLQFACLGMALEAESLASVGWLAAIAGSCWCLQLMGAFA